MPTRLPVTPLFLSDQSAEWIELKTTVATTQKASRLSLITQPEFIGYDANQTKWSVTYENPARGASTWTRLLAYVYNPKFDAALRWSESGSYTIEELRSVFLKAVEQDDDSLTQFVERDVLTSRLNQSKTFEELVNVWEWLSAPDD